MEEMIIKILRSLWPILRHVVSLSKRCKRCILSEAYVPLVNGLCPHCANTDLHKIPPLFDPAAPPDAQDRLDRYVQNHITDEPYHALLMLSGGKDSAYILDRFRKDYPDLRILCVMVNNGFMSPFAAKSAHHCAEKLKTDLFIANHEIDKFYTELRAAFLRLNGQGSYGIIDYTDGSLIFEVGKNIAQHLKIPLVIGGLTWVQAQMIIGHDDFELKKDGEPSIIFPLAVWRPNEQDIRAYVRQEGLLLDGSDDPVVSNSQLIVAMCAIDVLNLGYCSFEPEFAQLVREGKADRKTWIYNFETLEYGVRSGQLLKDVTKALSKLNLKLSDVVGNKWKK